MEEEKEKNKRTFRLAYIFYSPYIILMAICYAIGVIIAAFEAFFMFFVNREEYYHRFTEDEKHFRKIFVSMFND